MKIAIIGHGFVGKEVEKLIRKYYKYTIFDIAYKEEFGLTKEDINREYDAAIICVPTPPLPDGSCDTSIVEEVAGWVTVPHVLIKSTVVPGTIDRLNETYGHRFCFSPEYTGESSYYNPIMASMAEEPFVIFGGEAKETQFWVDVWQVMMGPLTKYIQTSAKKAELAKYLENAFFAAKVSFFNEFADICNAFDVEYDEVRELFLNDPRINRMHTSVFKGKRGFSGKCLPKDIQAIVSASEKAGYTPEIMKKVIERNKWWLEGNTAS